MIHLWPFPLLRNYPVKSDLTRLFMEVSADPYLELASEHEYEVVFVCSKGTLRAWNANRWYAWAGEGSFTNTEGETWAWKNEMPSRWAARQMRRAYERLTSAREPKAPRFGYAKDLA